MALGNLSMLKHLLSPKAPGRARGHGDKAKRHRRAYRGQRRPLVTARHRPAPPRPGSPPPPRLPAVRSHFSGPAFSVCERLLTLKAVAPGMGFFGGGGVFLVCCFFTPTWLQTSDTSTCGAEMLPWIDLAIFLSFNWTLPQPKRRGGRTF